MSYVMSEGGSAIKMTPELEAKIAAAPDAQAIKTLMREASIAQGLVQKDPFDPDGRNYFGYTPVQQPIPQGLAKTVIVNGQKHILEGATEDALQHAELELMRSLFSKPADNSQQRDSAGRFISAEARSAQAVLDAAAADAAARDAARIAAASVDPAADAEAAIVRRSLENQGISVEELKAFSDEKKSERYASTWQKAGEEFQKANPDWAGGDNYQVMLDLIQANPELMDKPSKETLALVWNHMKENNLVVENQEDAENRELSEARTPEDLAAVLRSRNRLQSLGTIFGH